MVLHYYRLFPPPPLPNSVPIQSAVEISPFFSSSSTPPTPPKKETFQPTLLGTCASLSLSLSLSLLWQHDVSCLLTALLPLFFLVIPFVKAFRSYRDFIFANVLFFLLPPPPPACALSPDCFFLSPALEQQTRMQGGRQGGRSTN